MKKRITTVAILLLSLALQEQTVAQGIEFIHDKKFQEILDMAKAQNKLVFMDCYTSWCGPCKRLASTVFPDSAVGEYFNANFINCKFDMEKDEGITISGNYSIRAYPTLLWLDYTGEVKHKIVGGLDPNGLIQNGMKATDPTPGILTGMRKRYSDGDRDVNFLSDYLTTMMGANEKYDEIFKVYLEKLTPADSKEAKHAKTIFLLTNNLRSPGMDYVMKNADYLKGVMGADPFNTKINTIASTAISQAPKADDVSLYNDAVKLLKANKAPDAQQKITQYSMDYYLHMADWTNYDKFASQYVKKYAAKNPGMLNDIAWNYYLNINNTAQLAKAVKWAYTAINIDNKYTYDLTYAYLLYKLNDYKEAEKACDYAIIKAGEENVSANSATFLKGAIQKSVDKAQQ